MATRIFSFPTFAVFAAVVLAMAMATEAGAAGFDEGQLGWVRAGVSRCDGTVGDCLVGEDEEMDMDTESNRRILATSNYISYGALQRNTVPCSRRGASYYNCQPGASSNPYSRGCSSISRCRS